MTGETFKLLGEIKKSVENVADELCEAARLRPGQIVVVGCSSSEITGKFIGTGGSAEIGAVVFGAIYRMFAEREIVMAAQCCEHLNRAIVIERAAASGFTIINAVPSVEAGGAFATAAYAALCDPVVIEEIYADAGIDIGGTLIGMHLKKVAVPLRLKTTHIGKAYVIAARTRPKLIGGMRAKYDDELM